MSSLQSEPHLVLAFAVFLLVQILTVIRDLRLKARMPDGIDSPTRIRGYYITIYSLWGLSLVSGAAWLYSGRPLATLGFNLGSDWGQWVAWILAFGIGLISVFQLIQLARMDEISPKIRAQIESSADLDMIAPTSPRELRIFFAMAVTAGIAEEIVFRGFAIPVLALWMPLWLAALVMVAIFTAVHVYQGPRGMLRVLPLSVVLTVMYVVSGSILPGIALHVTVDVVGGILFRLLHRDARRRSLHVENALD